MKVNDEIMPAKFSEGRKLSVIYQQNQNLTSLNVIKYTKLPRLMNTQETTTNIRHERCS